jgi:hypothetical protein
MADRNLACAIANGGNQVAFEEDRTDDTSSDMDEVETIFAEAPADMVEQAAFSEETMRAEDTEIIAAEMSLEQIDTVDSDIPEIECRSNEAPDPVSGMFAGPAPDSKDLSPFEVANPSGAAANDATTGPTATPISEGKANFSLDMEDHEGEEILITAPFDSYLDFNTEFAPEPAKPETDDKPEEQVPLAVEVSDTQETDDVVIVPVEEETESKPKRIGILKRIRSLFSRSRKQE